MNSMGKYDYIINPRKMVQYGISIKFRDRKLRARIENVVKR